jgi:RecB family endonuclease NucS
MSQPESRLQRRIRKALEIEYPGSVWLKYHGGAFTKAGVPDLLGVVEGRFVALEVKRAKGRVSPVQRVVQRRLKRAGAIVAVVRTPAEAIEVVEDALR